MKRANQGRPAVFLDKDGTLIDDVPYNVDPERIELSAGAVEGTALLIAAGYALVVVSNQSGVARGIFAEEAIGPVERRIRELLADYSIELDGFYYCPHHPTGNIERYAVKCECRKPAPGMLLTAAREFSLDLSASWLIGDILDDVEAAHAAGCRAVLLDNDHETVWKWNPARRPDLVAGDMLEAAQLIVSARASVPLTLEAVR
jgi:D-glycero-D-manno-heptose 1,7-bisphosphate phosphatase